MVPPQLALCMSDAMAIEAVSRLLSAVSSGAEIHGGNHLPTVLESTSTEGLRFLVVDAVHATPAALEKLFRGYPNAAVVVACDRIDDGLLTSAMRFPGLLGFVGRTAGQLRIWELAYLARRVLAPTEPVPGSYELLNWGASTVSFRPRTTKDLEQTVAGVEAVAFGFGIPRKSAVVAASAARDLLTNAMYEAPVDDRGRARYAAQKGQPITLEDREVPTLRLTVDGSFVALDCLDSYGRLAPSRVFVSLLKNRPANNHPGSGLWKLFTSSTILRVEVVVGQLTQVSWLASRGDPVARGEGQSLYVVRRQPSPPTRGS
jgi:hypothetical protein